MWIDCAALFLDRLREAGTGSHTKYTFRLRQQKQVASLGSW